MTTKITIRNTAEANSGIDVSVMPVIESPRSSRLPSRMPDSTPKIIDTGRMMAKAMPASFAVLYSLPQIMSLTGSLYNDE